jgi:hypothetical protein
MKIPTAFKPNSKQISALKSYLRVIASAGVAYVIHRFGADPQVSLLIGAVTAPLLKWLDPTEKSIGINSPK